MKYIKTFEGYPFDSYPGPPVSYAGGDLSVPAMSDKLAGGGSDGFIGGEFYKNGPGPTSKPFPTKYKQNITTVNKKETKKRRDAIKKIQQLTPTKILDFNQDSKPKKSLKRFDEFKKDSQ